MDDKKWDLRFLKLAKEVSTWSKDPTTKVGAIFVSQDKKIISTGYNGFATKVDDNKERYDDRETKIKLVVHAEINAIIYANRNELVNSYLYTYPLMPCSNCMAAVINCGCKTIISVFSINTKWNFDLTRMQIKEAGLKLFLYEPNEVF
jgi:dCMP deaminase